MTDIGATFCVVLCTSARLLALFCVCLISFYFNTRFLDQFFCCFPYLQFLIVSLFFCLTRLHDYMFACYLVFCIHVFFFLPCLHFRLLILLLFFQSFPCFRNLIKYYFCFFPSFLFFFFVHLFSRKPSVLVT